MEDKKYLVKNPSHAMIVEAINTIPGNIESLKLDFLADGLKIPFYPNEEERKEYIQTCKYQNIAPFSDKRIRYGSDVKGKISEIPEARKMYFGGGRTNLIALEVYKSFEKDLIKEFKELIFPSLLENNYKVSDGEVVLSGHKTGAHQEEGYGPDLALRINYGEKGLGLLLDEDYNKPEVVEEYAKWFGGLKEKYKIRD